MKPNRIKKSRRALMLGFARNITLLVFVLSIAAGGYLYFSLHPPESFFPVKRIFIKGNRHMTDDELKGLAGIRPNDSLVMISGDEVSGNLLKSPWIRAVYIRKEFPETLLLEIREAEPFALLETKGHLFLVDEKGKMLEELKGNFVPFLPVIRCDPFKERDGFAEALALAKLMTEEGFSADRDYIEIIAHKPNDLSVSIDGIIVKMGAGGYREKLDRLLLLEKDIKNMSLPVDYIDLRFGNKAIVKPYVEKEVH
jgi:cell division protein FtsQ